MWPLKKRVGKRHEAIKNSKKNSPESLVTHHGSQSLSKTTLVKKKQK